MMVDVVYTVRVAPLSIQDQRRENSVAVTRAKSASIIIELESLSIRAGSSWTAALSRSRYAVEQSFNDI